MFKIEHKIVKLPVSDYIIGYRDVNRFIEYCKECSNYGTIWVCPPYSFDTLERIKNYKYIHIVGTKVFIDDVTRHSPKNNNEQKEISHRVMKEGRKSIDEQLLKIETQYSGSLAFFAGSCYLCDKKDCTRQLGKNCTYPDKARSSLEAYGFDISKTTAELLGIELKWSENLVIPEYFILVSGLFTDYEIGNDFIIKQLK